MEMLAAGCRASFVVRDMRYKLLLTGDVLKGYLGSTDLKLQDIRLLDINTVVGVNSCIYGIW